MLFSMMRRPLAAAAHTVVAYAETSHRSISCFGFEQPDPRIYQKPRPTTSERSNSKPEKKPSPQEVPTTNLDIEFKAWRDQYLPITRICIPGVPATWGPDELAYSMLDGLEVLEKDTNVDESAVTPTKTETTLPRIETIPALKEAGVNNQRKP